MLEEHDLHEVIKSLKEKNTTLDYHVPEGGESLGDVSERMVDFFKTLCQSVYDKNKMAAGAGADDDSAGTSLPKESADASDPTAADVCETVLMVRWTLLIL